MRKATLGDRLRSAFDNPLAAGRWGRLPGWPGGDARRGYGHVLNPRKPDRITFSENDKVIVLAEA